MKFASIATLSILLLFSCKKEKKEESEKNNDYVCSTYEGTNLPILNEAITLYEDTIVDLPLGEAGKGGIWDYSILTADDTSEFKFISPASTPKGSKFPSATLSVEEDDQYVYLTQENNGYQVIGVAGSFEDNELALDLVDYYNLIDFPLEYGQKINDTYLIDHKEPNLSVELYGNTIVADTVHIIRRGKISRHVDACGEVTTPNGIYDAIRVYTEEVIGDTVKAYATIGVPPFGQTTWFTVRKEQSTKKRYEFYADAEKLPFLTIHLGDNYKISSVQFIKN